MKTISEAFKALLGLVLLVALVVGLALGGRWFVGWMFDGVNPTVAAAIVAGVATTLVSVLGVTLGRYLERRGQIEAELRERKIPIYTEFVEGIMKMFFESTSDEKPAHSGIQSDDAEFDLVKFFAKMTPQLIIWGSNDVVSTWSKFRRGGGTTPPNEYMFMMESLLESIRKDLGHAGELPKGSLLGTFINDIDDYVGK